MALFSRRNKSDSADASADRADTVIEPGEQPVDPARPAGDSSASDAALADTALSDAADAQGADAPAPTVGISVSSFRGVGVAPAPEPTPDSVIPARPGLRQPGPMVAPLGNESIPGLRDNALVADALAEIEGEAEPHQLLNIARQLLQGNLLLRVKGDARALIAEGKDLPLAVATRGDDQLVLAYSGGDTLRRSVEADGDHDTSAMAQPVMAVLKHSLENPFAGIILDHASDDARAVLPRALIERVVAEAHPALEIKAALSEPRTETTASRVVTALVEGAPLWIGVSQTEEGGPIGVAESRTATGERFLEVFSHPLELLALGRGDQPLPITTAQLVQAFAGDEGLTGLLVDPAGPWIRLGRAELAPVLSLAE